MPDNTAPDFASAQSLEQLYEMLDGVQMKNGWNKPTPSLYPEPRPKFVPAHWRYRDARAALCKAGDLVDPKWAERRNLIMANPIPGNDYPTVTTLVGAYQMVKGGETARSHRHTPNAMRVVLEAAPETYTIVNGVKVPMAPGDVLLTPNWCYHGHSNESAKEAYWVDFLDAPLVQAPGPMFFEHHPEEVERAHGIDESSPMRFEYADYRPKLLQTQEIAPGVRSLLLGPTTLLTFDRTALHLEPRTVWTREKTTVNRIYTVIEGSGFCHFGNTRVDWTVGDMLAVPSWHESQICSTTEVTLLQVSDAPLLEMLGWLR